jgi:hypothetical protein
VRRGVSAEGSPGRAKRVRGYRGERERKKERKKQRKKQREKFLLTIKK